MSSVVRQNDSPQLFALANRQSAMLQGGGGMSSCWWAQFFIESNLSSLGVLPLSGSSFVFPCQRSHYRISRDYRSGDDGRSGPDLQIGVGVPGGAGTGVVGSRQIQGIIFSVRPFRTDLELIVDF
jgi:hypothetical protein